MEKMGRAMTEDVTYPEIRRELLHYIYALANTDYQYENWITRKSWSEDEKDSLDFCIHFLFDDTNLASDPEASIGILLLNKEEAGAINRITSALNEVLDSNGSDEEDLTYLRSPQWVKVIETARAALKIFRMDPTAVG
jgi:hypothetical protein